jgi:hypothetical protein
MDIGGELITPCNCNSKVHRECLDIWRKTIPYISHNNHRDKRCEVCLKNYEFEGEVSYTKYNKCLIIWDMFKMMFIFHAIGFLLGIIISHYAEITTTLITTKYLNIYIYQYLLGNIIIHIVIGLLVNYTINYDYLLCLNISERRKYYDCFILIITLVMTLIIGLLFTVIGVYYLSIERSKKRQLLINDNRYIKDLGMV